MKTLPPSVAKILAAHVIANERILECDGDERGMRSVQFVQDTVSRAYTAARIGTMAEKAAMTGQMLVHWEDQLKVFTNSPNGADRCIASRCMRTFCLGLLCLGVEDGQASQFDRLFGETVAAIRGLLHTPLNTPKPYLYNITKRLESLEEMMDYANGKLRTRTDPVKLPVSSFAAAAAVLA